MNRLAMLAALVSLPLVACSNDTSEGSTEVSLRSEGMPIIAMRCGGCHTRMSPPFPEAVGNMIYFETPEDVLGLRGSFIVAGDSGSSGFMAILRQEMAVGMGPTLMPPPMAAEPMPAAEVEAIGRWIDEGAQDN